MSSPVAAKALESERGSGTIRTAPVSGYRPELDVIRFVAFLLVFCHHRLRNFAAYIAKHGHYATAHRASFAVLGSAADACGMGLCLFFCLSAYLITAILLAEREKIGHISVRKFYIRRILRIWPLYAFGLLLGISWAWSNHLPQWARLTAYVFFVGNVYCTEFGWSVNPITPLWSISLEEQFYFIWAWAMRFLSRRGLWLASFTLICLANVTLYKLGAGHPNADTTVWANTFVQFQMFATGIILALMGKRSIRARTDTVFLLASGPFLWFVACLFLRVKMPTAAGEGPGGPALIAGYAMIALGCAAVMQGICSLDPLRFPKWTVGLGKISYGLYVYHLLAINLVSYVVGRCHLLYVPFSIFVPSLLLTIVAAKLSYAFLESPFLRLKRRFEVLHTRPV